MLETHFSPNGERLNGSLQNSDQLHQVRSIEAEEVMGKVPPWIIQRGLSLLLCILVALLIGAYFIKYPEVVVANVTVSSYNPPVKIVSQVSSRIDKLFVQNEQQVKKGDILSALESTTDFRDAILLKELLKKLDQVLLEKELDSNPLPKHLDLGELQASYFDLYQAIDQYLFLTKKRFFEQKAMHLQQQVKNYDRLNANLILKKELLKKQLIIESRNFKVDSSLEKDKVITPNQLTNSEKQLLNEKINTYNIKGELIQNKLQQANFLITMDDLKKEHEQLKNSLMQDIREKAKFLQSTFSTWEHKYVLRSPIAGKLSVFKYWHENQYVGSGEPIFIIVPETKSFIVKAFLPIDRAGKVRVGQNVRVKLSEFPFEEFGMLNGVVFKVSDVALDANYALEIRLPHGFKSTKGIEIPANPELSGTLEILTDNKSVLERLFQTFYKSFNK